jgi:catechol 2,3-dioxygenase
MIASDAPLSIGQVSLTVRDLDAVSRYYEHALGLQLVTSGPASRQLGTGGTVLLDLLHDPQARRSSPREAGLFHTAFLVPTRGDLARWVRHAAEARLQIQGASDHLVSEAIYLADPEGNGIEIYADRPRSGWKMRNGQVEMASDPLDIDDLLKQAGTHHWHGFPAGGIIGHVHLQVGAIAPAEAFYTGVLGMDLTCRYPGGSFFSSGGYHHHLAANIWNSRGAEVRGFPSTGLADVQLVAADDAVLEAVGANMARTGAETQLSQKGLSLRDPWGTSISIVRKG